LAHEGKTPVYLGVDGRLAALLAIADTLKETSAPAPFNLINIIISVE
jgi:Cu+-exporting ATPase